MVAADQSLEKQDNTSHNTHIHCLYIKIKKKYIYIYTHMQHHGSCIRKLFQHCVPALIPTPNASCARCRNSSTVKVSPCAASALTMARWPLSSTTSTTKAMGLGLRVQRQCITGHSAVVTLGTRTKTRKLETTIDHELSINPNLKLRRGKSRYGRLCGSQHRNLVNLVTHSSSACTKIAERGFQLGQEKEEGSSCFHLSCRFGFSRFWVPALVGPGEELVLIQVLPGIHCLQITFPCSRLQRCTFANADKLPLGGDD